MLVLVLTVAGVVAGVKGLFDGLTGDAGDRALTVSLVILAARARGIPTPAPAKRSGNSRGAESCRR